MTTLAVTLISVTSVVLLIWITRHVRISTERRRGFQLDENYPTGDEMPMVSVMIAAKDEAANIGRCVTSMLEQDYDNFEIIVINDRSSDDTAKIVERIAEYDSRLRLINVAELPHGWCGKNNAMNIGIAQARADWICMIDADCHQTSNRTLRVAVQYAIDNKSDLLSVLPNLEMKGFWENVVQPVCGGVMMIWFTPDRVNNPDHPEAYANGAFMLIRRDAYDKIGGHTAVRDRVNEDMHMASLVKKAGLHLRVVRNRDLYLVRMYTSLKAIVRGWARIFYGTFGTFRRLMVSLMVLVVMGLVPYATLATGLWAKWAGAGSGGLAIACTVLGAVTVAMQLSVIFRFRRLIEARADLFWSYPIACVVAIVSVLLALTKLCPGAQVTWRNTTYTRGDMDE